MSESDGDCVPLSERFGRRHLAQPPREITAGEEDSEEEEVGIPSSAPSSSDEGASSPSRSGKRTSSDDSDDSEAGVAKRGRRGEAWGPTQPQGGGEDEDEDEERHATPATNSPAVRSKRAAEAGGVNEHVRRERRRDEADQSLRSADADAAAGPNGGQRRRPLEITKYEVVKAPAGWPTGDPASALGKGFLFHLYLQSWSKYAGIHRESYLQVDDEREEEDELLTEKAAQLAAARVDPAVHARGAAWSSPRTFAGVVASCKAASEVGGVPAVFFKEPLRRLAPYVGGNDADPPDVESAWSDAPSIPWPDAVRNMTEVQLAHERFEAKQACAVTVCDKVEYCFSKVGVQLGATELAMLNELLHNAEASTPLEIGRFAAAIAAQSYRYGAALNGSYELYEVDGGMYSRRNASKRVMAQVVQEKLMRALRLVKRLFCSGRGHHATPPDTFSPPGAAAPCCAPLIEQAGPPPLLKLLKVIEDAGGRGCTWAKVKDQMDTYVLNPSFMRQLGLPTPDEVWELLDNDPYLLGFNDGVYSFREWRFYKKGAVPASFAVSMSCGYNFPGDENGDVPPELAAEVADFERQTVHKLTAGDPETCAQLKDWLASQLIGDPALIKMVAVLTGAGDNGKTILVAGSDDSLGDYAGGFGRGAFYTKLESGGEGPKPELASNMKRRSAAVHEAASQKKLGFNGALTAQPINGELVKEYSGGDPVPFRGLYEGIQRAVPQFKLVFVANRVPDMRGADKATLNRIYPIDLKCKFTKNAAEVDEANHVYLAQSSAEARDFYKTRRHIMMLLRIRYLKDLHKRNYVLAPVSKQSLSGAELRDQDMDLFVRGFMEERFTKTDGSMDRRKTPEQLEHTLFSFTKLHCLVKTAVQDDETLSARAEELTPGELQVKLRAAGYNVVKTPGSCKPYYKDGGKWVVHVAIKPPDGEAPAGSPPAHESEAADDAAPQGAG